MSNVTHVSNFYLQPVKILFRLLSKTKIETDEIKAYIVLYNLRRAIDRELGRETLSLFFRGLFSRDYGEFTSSSLWLSDLRAAIDNAQTFIIYKPTEPTWEHLVEKIRMYALNSNSEMIEECIAEVEKLLKLR